MDKRSFNFMILIFAIGFGYCVVKEDYIVAIAYLLTPYLFHRFPLNEKLLRFLSKYI